MIESCTQESEICSLIFIVCIDNGIQMMDTNCHSYVFVLCRIEYIYSNDLDLMDSCRWNWFEIVRMLLFYTNIVFNLYFEIWQAWKPWHHQTESPYFFQFVEALPVHSSRFDRSSQSYSITIRLFNLTQPKWLFSFVLTDRFRDSSHFIWLEAKQGFRKEKTKQNVQAANQSTNLFLCLRSYRSMISRRLPIFSVYSFQDVCVR